MVGAWADFAHNGQLKTKQFTACTNFDGAPGLPQINKKASAKFHLPQAK